MKERRKQILEFIIEHSHASVQELMSMFGISKRTLYYDIESINYLIRNCGQIKKIEGMFSYVGTLYSLGEILKNSDSKFDSIEERKNYFLYKVLCNSPMTIDKLVERMQLSKNTIVQTIEYCKHDISKIGLQLIYRNNQYNIDGDEDIIRDLYLILMQDDNNLINHMNKEILDFDRKHQLELTDYSLCSLSKFVAFINQRIANGNHISKSYDLYELKTYSYVHEVSSLLLKPSNLEVDYLTAYIASLSSLKLDAKKEMIDIYVNKLISLFEAKSAIELESKAEFKKNIRQHLLSSYYRIKFHFPIHNPSLDEIKRKHASLFKIIKSIIENTKDFPDFVGIRDEEIGFLATYFGGYLKGARSEGRRKNKVLIVCPNGLMVSKTLEIQLYKFIPTIEIVDSISLSRLREYDGYYDYIISTVAISNHENVIVVKPLLTKMDIDLLLNKLICIDSNLLDYDIDAMIEVIKGTCIINNDDKLRNDLKKLFFRQVKKENYQPMLKELITEKRIQKIKSVKNWEEAITLAASPLILDDSITSTYVTAMIDSINSHGPYIVLADYFALPHASANAGVNRLSMSLLVVEDEVDLLGKPVNVFMVLATIDSTSHMKALASLAELMYDSNTIGVFKQGDKSSILELINKQE